MSAQEDSSSLKSLWNLNYFSESYSCTISNARAAKMWQWFAGRSSLLAQDQGCAGDCCGNKPGGRSLLLSTTWHGKWPNFAWAPQPNSSFQCSSYPWGSETRGSWPQECKELDNITAAVPLPRASSEDMSSGKHHQTCLPLLLLLLMMIHSSTAQCQPLGWSWVFVRKSPKGI